MEYIHKSGSIMDHSCDGYYDFAGPKCVLATEKKGKQPQYTANDNSKTLWEVRGLRNALVDAFRASFQPPGVEMKLCGGLMR